MLKTTFLLAVLCICSSVYAQNQVPTEEPIVPPKNTYVRKFRSITDTYYGFPNIFALFFRPIAAVSGATGVSVKSLGPTGAKYEFMITDNFGIGADANYSNIVVSFQKTNSKGVNYTYKVSSPALRTMIGFNIHKVKKKKWDFYSALKFGYYDRSIKFETDDPDYVAPKLNWPLHLAMRIETGLRYFPTRFTGIHFNMGFLGSAFLNLGVSQVF